MMKQIYNMDMNRLSDSFSRKSTLAAELEMSAGMVLTPQNSGEKPGIKKDRSSSQCW
ncbi:hypothetical protein HDE68_000354 [Pedobacter cryoconitis]|uniref:Uncharacterized protein n=1 Tax=Pedobacter cryoconitis TaxID=188932 RepID=A0A7W8ZI53_9SPHI|nr:hypothetical protein [Pedobacter cryoconitis]MBB5634469.1 hypothetical protein [Pedobacter cryoconitis]